MKRLAIIRRLQLGLTDQSGFILPLVVAMAIALSAMGVAVATILYSDMQTTTHTQRALTAMNAAEAGINYYLWHLSHNATDYQDGNTGTGQPPYGPYTHNYTNSNGDVIGTYSLYITPPANGSTVTTVKSVGTANGLTANRTVQAQLGIPSFANYVLLTNTEVWFGPTESSSGPVHSNVGVHFDGNNSGPVEASNTTYTPGGSFGGDGQVHNGVWGTGGPQTLWQYPVPVVDFNSVTANLQSLMSSAQANGVYLGASNKLGYYLNLKSNGTIDIYTVKTESSGGITTTFVRNQAAPSNGIIYVSDNVWVAGTSFPGRLTIASGRLPANPSTYTTIKISGNLTYAAKDGSAAIGLIAQGDIALPQYVPATMEIDAALLSQNGHVWYPYVGGSVETNLIFYGAIATNNYWTWNWVDGNNNIISGFSSDTNTFDSHLTFAPPPSYPTTGTYTVLNWREVLFNP